MTTVVSSQGGHGTEKPGCWINYHSKDQDFLLVLSWNKVIYK